MLMGLLQLVVETVQSHLVLFQISIVVVLAIYYYVLVPFILSPLRAIPGPYFHRVSYIPWLNGQRNGTWIQKVYDLHQQYGNILILSPTEISVNGHCKFITDIYTKNFPKSKFYENFRNHGFKDNIFASLENNRHLKYKKLIMALYKKSAIFSPLNNTRSILIDASRDLVQAVFKGSVEGSEPDLWNARAELNIHGKGKVDPNWFNKSGWSNNLAIDVYTLFGALAMDVVTRFELGKDSGTSLLQFTQSRKLIAYHCQVSSMGFWTTLAPKFWNWVASKEILKAADEILKFQLNLYKHAELNPDSNGKNLTTLGTLKQNGITGEYAYSFLTDNIFAGHETTATQLTYLFYELSRPVNFPLQQQLRKELAETFGRPSSINDVIDDLETVDSLPYLNAVLDENSRVHTSIPGAEPRVVDRNYIVELSTGKLVEIPIGTTISCLPYAIHRQENVFPDSNRFIPERWLAYPEECEKDYQARIKLQKKYMMPFGKGIRMCLGMNLALIEMKLAIANLYWHYSTKIDPDWCAITKYNTNQASAEIKIGRAPARGGAHHDHHHHHHGGNVPNTDEDKMIMYDAYTSRPLYDECWLRWYRDDYSLT
ncbi:cytochrome P450 [Spathaspora passalidarum NRRL Y-27907]|uniref:Cytochrome P450 n=1 Tax=Spathaspora passalidarum (strain NRRL Y-27907 / 11-Y1) TaxID=619300 RepID=G3AF38_SPAPN|nr:cytochrome P450 [Spathaspora passalidarum NRRL Y-27907]EGW35814.1 cytochrome P450 [Spathaspora passalidarum NRRL Y-27907]